MVICIFIECPLKHEVTSGSWRPRAKRNCRMRASEPSSAIQEFIALLKSLNNPWRRGSAWPRCIARAVLATQCVVQSDGIQSAASLAALMASGDQKSMHLQRLQHSNVRRLWRLIVALGKARRGALKKKNIKEIRAKPECL